MQKNIELEAIHRELDIVTSLDAEIKSAYSNMVQDRFGIDLMDNFDAVPKDCAMTPFMSALTHTTTRIVTLKAKADIVNSQEIR